MAITQNDIKNLKTLLDNNQIAELFEELDRLHIADLRLSRLKDEFILGKTDVDFIGRLKVFINEIIAKGLNIHKKGEILYQIPNAMQLAKVVKCIIRIAISQEALIQNIKITDDTHIESIKIAKIMEVVLTEPPFEQNFEIKLVSQPEQMIDFEEDEFTEWVFYVKPLVEGAYTLILKVAVIEMIDNKERKKEIVLERAIEVSNLLVESYRAEDKFEKSDAPVILGNNILRLDNDKNHNIDKTVIPPVMRPNIQQADRLPYIQANRPSRPSELNDNKNFIKRYFF